MVKRFSLATVLILIAAALFLGTQLNNVFSGDNIYVQLNKFKDVLSYTEKYYVDEVNANLASFEQIKKFAVLSNEFSIAEGEMTPTLKMKRNVIEDRYREVIDQLYS